MSKSLVILEELGRDTTTFDGHSLWLILNFYFYFFLFQQKGIDGCSMGSPANNHHRQPPLTTTTNDHDNLYNPTIAC